MNLISRITFLQQAHDSPAGGNAEFSEDILEVLLQGGLLDAQGFRDLPIVPEAGEQLQELGLSGGEAVAQGDGGDVIA